MNLKLSRLVLADTTFVIGAGMTFAVPVLADNVTEEEISLQDLPSAVANTVQSELGDKAEEFEKISCEGMDVLYEAESKRNGKEYEIYVFPNGQVAGRHSHEEEEE